MEDEIYKCPHCKEEFEILNSDDIRIFQPNARTLSVKCNKCNKNSRLTAEKSAILFERFPELEDELEKVKSEKVNRDIESDQVTIGDFEEKFRDSLSIFGLDGKKYKNKIDAIVKLIERTGSSKEWLRYHMQRLSFTNQKTIESVVDLVYLDENDQGNMPPRPVNSQGQVPGYITQHLPGGQVILIPQNQPSQMQSGIQPIIIDRGGDRSDRVVRDSNDESTVIEELDDEGKVKKRIIKGGSKHAAQTEKQEDQTLRIITMLKDFGLIQTPHNRTEQQTSSVPDEIRDTLAQLKDAIIVLGSPNRDQTSKPQNEEIKQMSATVSKLTEQIQQYEKEKRDKENQTLRDELAEVKNMIANIDTRRGSDVAAAGLSDAQFGLHTQNKNLTTVTESVEHFGDRITAPMNEILRNQQKMNSLLLVRDIEKQDGVAPGTYMKVLTPTISPNDGEVQNTVKRWQDKAASIKGGS